MNNENIKFDKETLVGKLLEITENNVHQLVHFKNELKLNNEKFNTISKNTSSLLENVESLVQKLEIMESHHFIDKVSDLSIGSELKHKDVVSLIDNKMALLDLELNSQDQLKQTIFPFESLLNLKLPANKTLKITLEDIEDLEDLE
jgi:hypothetical protein